MTYVCNLIYIKLAITCKSYINCPITICKHPKYICIVWQSKVRQGA
nr:MAG TPA: hypothetical protein [Caudoviricetes sp.]